MRVCILHNNFDRSSGSAMIIRRLYEAFDGSGIEFFFAGCSATSEGGRVAKEDFSWMPEGQHAYFNLMSSPTVWPRELGRLRRWVLANQCNLVHVHHRRLAAFANLLFSPSSIPVLYTAHNTFAWTLWFWLFAPPFVSGVGPSVVDYLKRSTRVQSPLLTWNPYPFAECASTIKDLSLVRERAISVGRLERVKGHAALILAWKKLQSMGLYPQLSIFGEGHLREELLTMIRVNGLENQVHLRGFTDNLGKEFSSSLFNVLCSSTEGFPNVVVEAAAQSTATLVTDVDGSRDTVPPDVLLPNKVKFDDIDSLANHLAQWFASPAAVLEDGQTFRRFLMERCTTETVRENYARIYERLLGQATLGLA